MPKMLRKTLYWAPFMAAGPITGPLLEGALRHWRKGERWLAGMYAVAIVTTFFALPSLLVLMTRWTGVRLPI